MRKRVRFGLILGAVIVSVLAVIYLLHRNAAPEPARLLPEADAIIYGNLRPVRLAMKFTGAPAVTREPDYEEFVRQTGIEFERDLDEAAFAIHAPTRATPEKRYSEIFVGRFDSLRLRDYLQHLAAGSEDVQGTTVFNIHREDRTVRAAILGIDTVAVSNVDDPANIRGMVERYHRSALPFSGPSLLHDHYQHVPYGSLVWTLARIAAPQPGNDDGLIFPRTLHTYAGGSVLVGSIRYLGSVHLRVEAFTAGEDQARKLNDNAANLLTVFRMLAGAAPSASPSDASRSDADRDLNAFFDSITVEQHGDRVALNATVAPALLKKLVSEPPSGTTPLAAPAPAAPPPETRKPAPKRRSR